MVITLHLQYDPRKMARARLVALVAILLCCVADETQSETVTLTTYYPAPSGVYTTMITTQNAYLARDSGAVIVGSTGTPGLGTKLTVMSGNVGIGTLNPSQALDVSGSINVSGTVYAAASRNPVYAP